MALLARFQVTVTEFLVAAAFVTYTAEGVFPDAANTGIAITNTSRTARKQLIILFLFILFSSLSVAYVYLYFTPALTLL